MPSSAVAVPLIGSVAGPVVSAVLGSGSNKKAAQASAQGKDQQLALASGQVATNTAAFQPYTRESRCAPWLGWPVGCAGHARIALAIWWARSSVPKSAFAERQ